jgi:hypothetical protein
MRVLLLLILTIAFLYAVAGSFIVYLLYLLATGHP